MQVVLTAINSKYIHTGLGLRYVGEYAKAQGHQVQLIEETINSQILAVLEKLMATKGQVYGFSVHIWNRPFVMRLIRMLKQLRPHIKIVLGGPEVAFAAKEVLQQEPAVDFLVQGEGELLFSNLLKALEEQAPIPAHIAYRKEGQVDLNGGVAVVEDLALLPFPYPDLETLKEQHKIVYYECTRGCPFNCSYCLSGISRRVRRRPLDLVLKDLEVFIRSGVELVKFVDRTYNLAEEYFLPIMEYLAKAKTKATFHFEIKADMLSQKVLDFLATVPKGRFQMEIGIQTTHEPTLKAINRRDNWAKLAYNCQQLLSFKNMHLHVDLIAGLPYEGLAEFRKSFNDVYGLKAHMLQLGFLKVLPGTQMAKETDDHGLIYMGEPPYEILATKYMVYEELQLLKRLENVFEQTANTGAFGHILAYMLKWSGKDAFSFYIDLTHWWVKAGHYPQSHNLKGVAKILWDYIKESGLFTKEQQGYLVEILRYDVFKAVAGWYPEWLGWQKEAIFTMVSDFWRDEERVGHYLPGYSFSSWRQIHKQHPIEAFAFDWERGEPGTVYLMLNGEEEYRLLL